MNMRRWLAAGFFIAAVVFVFMVRYLPFYHIPEQTLVLEFEARAQSPLQAYLIHDFKNEGRLWPEDATGFQIPYAPQFRAFRFTLPRQPIRFLRIDLMNPSGDVAFRSFRILDEENAVVTNLPPEQIESLNANTTTQVEDGALHVVWGRPEAQPSLWLGTAYPIRPAPSPVPVTTGAVVFLWAVLMVYFVLGVWMVVRALLRDRLDRGEEANRDPMRWAFSWLAAALLIILGTKMTLIAVYGNSIPCWDSWEFEGWATLAPFLQGNLSWEVLFENNNEHRHFFSRVVSLGLMLLNGRWDEQVGTLFNAFLHTSIAMGLCLLLWRLLGRRYIVPICALVIMVFASPFSWENVLRASQSPFYFSVGFTMLAIWLLTCSEPLSARWWTGLTFALFASFSLASGMLSVCAVIGMLVFRTVRKPSGWKPALITAAGCGLIILVGVIFSVKEKAHAGWGARNAGDFFLALFRAGAWPLTDYPWVAPVIWLPFVVLLVYYLTRKNDRCVSALEVLMALGMWVGLQVLTFALFRGGGGAAPESRHADSMSVSLVINGVAGILLVPRIAGWRGIGRAWRWLVPAWWALVVIGMLALSAEGLYRKAPEWKAFLNRTVAAVRTFLQTDNSQQWMQMPENSMPYVRYVMPSFLRNPHMRAILPHNVTAPIALVPQAAGGGGFRPEGYSSETPPRVSLPTWGSDLGPRPQQSALAFVSQVIQPPALPYLAFEVAGDFGEPNLELAVRGVVSGKRQACTIGSSPGADWATVVVRSPAEPFVVEAIDAHGGKWFAFSAPMPVTRLSAWTHFLLAKGNWILRFGFALIALMLARRFVLTLREEGGAAKGSARP